ncbi:MAG: hypothetical protein Q9184_006574 [Pyrenodesmia sp. 2 TL-2023]
MVATSPIGDSSPSPGSQAGSKHPREDGSPSTSEPEAKRVAVDQPDTPTEEIITGSPRSPFWQYLAGQSRQKGAGFSGTYGMTNAGLYVWGEAKKIADACDNWTEVALTAEEKDAYKATSAEAKVMMTRVTKIGEMVCKRQLRTSEVGGLPSSSS